MPSINRVQLAGHLGKDPETKAASTGMTITTFSMATSRKKKDGEEVTQWHNVKLFGKVAEIAQERLKKGSGVYVEGMLETRSYEKDGQKHWFTEVLANIMLPIERVNHKDDAKKEDANGDDLPF